STARPNESAHHPAAAACLRKVPSPKSSADALLHQVAALRHTANRAHWCSDSSCASDRAAFETRHIALLIAARPVSAARSRKIQPTESPSTRPRRSDADKCALPAAPASTNRRDRMSLAY